MVDRGFGNGGGQPVTHWRHSTASSPNGNCVELAALSPEHVLMRNSRHPQERSLVVSRDELAAFLAGIRAGEFDDLGVEPTA